MAKPRSDKLDVSENLGWERTRRELDFDSEENATFVEVKGEVATDVVLDEQVLACDVCVLVLSEVDASRVGASIQRDPHEAMLRRSPR